tara:strand:- start:219 stop:644 length:426 start_codon:yes stop_codon:yes gene_type:complete
MDSVFSRLIREASDWTCAKCHKKFTEGARNLHCSHFFGRRAVNTRWDPDNVFAHCFRCHQFLGENPAIFTEWAQDARGAEWYEDMLFEHNRTLKLNDKDREELYNEMKETYDAILKMRGKGTTGPIQVKLRKLHGFRNRGG